MPLSNHKKAVINANTKLLDDRPLIIRVICHKYVLSG